MKGKDVVNRMMEQDYFSQWLGIEVLEVKEGFCRLRMKVRKEMLNGFGIAHGGITFSLADSALAFASNSKGRKSLSIDTSINHVESVKENDVITARASMVAETGKLGHYEVHVHREGSEKPVALFKGMVYITSSDWN